MKRNVRYAPLLISCLLTAWLVSGCDSDVRTLQAEEVEEQVEEVEVEVEVELPVDTGDAPFALTLANTTVAITEGSGQITLPVTLTRVAGYEGDVTLTAEGQVPSDELFLTSSFEDATLNEGETNTQLQLELAIAPRPIQPQTRAIAIRATDSQGRISSAVLSLRVQPTVAPDVYLLIGQSNMIGISEDDARQSLAGEPDEPVESIRQLNVTFNDDNNFSQASDFTNPAMLFNTGNPLTVALDPLHSGLQSNGSKSGTRIGMGISFAKRAINDTTAQIFLVPAAWSDTGFCQRESNTVPGIGWNATTKTNPALSGTLLHDRAIARANIALDQTGGVLRGILWHQGEADSEDSACAQTYAANLTEMIESLRTNINPDARGALARGPDAAIPFIVGTMAMGDEQAPFSPDKLLVDAAHRNIANAVTFADFVNNDDLVPPAFACGGGSCIHFGAVALREMGGRYYDRLIETLP